jgi:hypothetical protein
MSYPGAGIAPQMPTMPMLGMMEKFELKATGKTDKILGYTCEQYELKQRGETVEIWATGQLFPYEPYMRNQPRRLGPQMIEDQWPRLLKERKLFPVRGILRFDKGAERARFEVKSIESEKLKPEDAKLFEPPPGYFENQPLPF